MKGEAVVGGESGEECAHGRRGSLPSRACSYWLRWVKSGSALPKEGRHVLAERVAQEAPRVGQILSCHVGVVRRGPAVSQPGDFAAQRAQRHYSLLWREEDTDASFLLHSLQLLPAQELG